MIPPKENWPATAWIAIWLLTFLGGIIALADLATAGPALQLL